MATKTRDDRVPNSGTYYYRPTGVTKVDTVMHGAQQVQVGVDPGWNQDNFFEQQKLETYTPGLTGTEFTSGGIVVKQFANYPIGYRPTPPPVTAFAGLPSLTELHNKCVHVAALTNPSRASTSGLSMIGEMRDIPTMTKRFGRNALAAVSRGYITWRFAYKPLLNDLRVMSKFTKAVQSRFHELTKLAERKWVGKSVNLGSYTAATPPQTVMVHSEGAYVSAYRRVKFTRKEWASIRWKLLVKPPLSAMARYDLSERLVSGITCYEALVMAWELTPWSWLTDWFWGLGDWLAANNNTIPAVAGGFCWMATDTAESSYDVISKPEWVNLLGPHSEKTTRKIRLVPDTTALIPPVPALPALTGGQLSILGGLQLGKTDFTSFKMKDLRKKRR